jgi:hypothetical protein
MSGAIADEMKHQFDVTIDKKRFIWIIQKTLGEYSAELRLHHEVVATSRSAWKAQHRWQRRKPPLRRRSLTGRKATGRERPVRKARVEEGKAS